MASFSRHSLQLVSILVLVTQRLRPATHLAQCFMGRKWQSLKIQTSAPVFSLPLPPSPTRPPLQVAGHTDGSLQAVSKSQSLGSQRDRKGERHTDKACLFPLQLLEEHALPQAPKGTEGAEHSFSVQSPSRLPITRKPWLSERSSKTTHSRLPTEHRLVEIYLLICLPPD